MKKEEIVYFFFFQAEAGIRDVAVTGVQTCALPISRAGAGGGPPRPGGGRGRSGTQGAFGRPGGRPSRGRKSKKQRRQEFDNMQAPTIGGVQVPRGNGQV